jgi:hypothetical protein
MSPEYNLSPRLNWDTWVPSPTNGKGEDTVLMLIDTEREKAIGLGTTYPFPPQKEAECLVSKET